MKDLVKLINNSHYDIYFLVVDKNLDIDLPELKYFYKIYLPEGELKNSGHLLSLKNTQDLTYLIFVCVLFSSSCLLFFRQFYRLCI